MLDLAEPYRLVSSCEFAESSAPGAFSGLPRRLFCACSVILLPVYNVAYLALRNGSRYAGAQCYTNVQNHQPTVVPVAQIQMAVKDIPVDTSGSETMIPKTDYHCLHQVAKRWHDP